MQTDLHNQNLEKRAQTSDALLLKQVPKKETVFV
jgi:hypothetical protein